MEQSVEPLLAIDITDNDKLQSLVEALHLRRNLSQMQEIQSGIKLAIRNNDIHGVVYWYKTMTSAGLDASSGLKPYAMHVRMFGAVFKRLQRISLESDSDCVKALEQQIESAQIIRIIRICDPLWLDQAECTVKCHHVYHKEFNSDEDRMAAIKQFICSLDVACCDARLVPELRQYSTAHEIVAAQKRKLVDAVHLNVLEDLFDVIQETDRMGLPHLDELEAAKVT